VKTLSLADYFLVRVPDQIVDGVDIYLDDLYENTEAESHGGNLVGAIKNGRELTVQIDERRVRPLTNLIRQLSLRYYQEYCRKHGILPSADKQPTLVEMWSVHSFAGDYNPLHHHSGPTIQALSGFMFVQVPPQISARSETSTKRDKSAQDGCTFFVFGQNLPEAQSMFRHPQQVLITPEVGMLYLFPNWLEHIVYPFEGLGERRTIAFNIFFA